MSGQDATLTMEQAKKQQERIECNNDHQGPKKSKGSAHTDHVCEKIKHQG